MKIRVAALAVVVVALMSCAKSSKKSEASRPTTVVVPAFLADSAYTYIDEQCRFGARVPGTQAHEDCLNYIVSKMKQFSPDTIIVQRGRASLYNRSTIDLANVVVSYNAECQQRMIICAHWDSRPFADKESDPERRTTPILGANDGASGVGVIIELARIMSAKRPDIGVDLMLFDLEDYGAPEWSDADGGWTLGSEYWARHKHVQGYKARMAILLDMVGAANARFYREYFSERYASWLVDAVWRRAADKGFDNVFVNQRGGAITDDHLPLNTIAGIPAVDIVHFVPESETGFPSTWHTHNDNMEHISRETLAVVGALLVDLIYNPI